MEETAQSRAIGTDGANRESSMRTTATAATPRRSSRATSNRARCGCWPRTRRATCQDILQDPVTRAVQAYASNFTRLEWHALDPARWPRT